MQRVQHDHGELGAVQEVQHRGGCEAGQEREGVLRLRGGEREGEAVTGGQAGCEGSAGEAEVLDVQAAATRRGDGDVHVSKERFSCGRAAARVLR